MPLDKNTRSDGGVVPEWGGKSARDARGDQRRQEGERGEERETNEEDGEFFLQPVAALSLHVGPNSAQDPLCS